MGTGTTDTSGNATIVLNMPMVNSPADLGDGNDDAFNADIAVIWDNGDADERYAILTLGGSTPVSVTPDPNEIVSPNPSGVASADRTHEATGTNYVPVLAENSSNGMKVHFEMTHTTSTDRQTSAQVAWSFDGTAPFSVGSFLEETKSRQYSKPWNASGSYHRYVWANYGFWKWKVVTCGIRGCLRTKHKWIIHDWTQDLTDDNPNPACNGCTNKVGKVDYNVPPYTTNYNYTVLLSVNSPSAQRDSSILNSYGFMADFAGFVTIHSKATYGNITSVTWDRLSTGCSSPNSRLLWGNGYTVPSAPIVQANCFVRPSP